MYKASSGSSLLDIVSIDEGPLSLLLSTTSLQLGDRGLVINYVVL